MLEVLNIQFPIAESAHMFEYGSDVQQLRKVVRRTP